MAASPDDFGLSPEATLAEVGSSVLPPGFMQFFDGWLASLRDETARFEEADGDALLRAGAPGITHTLASHGGVHVGCHVARPAGEPTGVVVTTHGYGVAPGDPLSDDGRWTSRGMITIRLRARGFPGSQMDVGDLTGRSGGYIVQGIESLETWVLTGAVADLINTVRAARAMVGPGVPICMHGESFGGGIAILAASLLQDFEPVTRLAIALPTFGHWAWRHEHPIDAGSGADIRRRLESGSVDVKEVMHSLRLLDTVVHAARVHCPTVAKLALRDEIVPAPTAAAVYNALGSDPGKKWRFIVRFGHHIDADMPMADLRRHAMFEQLSAAFLDPSEDIDALMDRWDPVLIEGTEAPR
ncbi:MAG: acetylxylan esterase [Planctomycetota bacterium]